ncbi:uncharacterized protein LOC121265781 [Juglans microcarpa x Juglans regia]|uniref:uncharacterized protein LOC121265781 n=1 Tax=Juglans microcarpa x Juglans regia TaxID=2249226 RepID=UPI001B7DA20A|nr:uncharacterized protein LOC121265781 [Juglans microcarpa x Juglans regia]
MEDCLKHLEPRVTREENDKLLRPFSKEEIEEAITIGDDVCAAVLDHLNGIIPFQPVNFTFIALIPKKKDPKVIITENIMIAYEVLHTMKVGKKGKKGSMAIKLDKSKPYDRIEWPFVKAVMKRLGFCDAWIELVMSYLSGNTKGVIVVRGGSRVNHLLFADDCILFGRACAEEWKRLQELLLSQGSYSKRRGSLVQGSYEKYLGLPTMVGKSKYNTFRCLKERVWQKINSWKNYFLSGVGKEVLIKAVPQAIPSYTMSVFKLPKKLCKEINIMLSKFWWGNGIHWRSWEKMGVAKGKGGLGFRDLASFNLALLAKQAWRLLQSPQSLVAKIFKEKYHKNTSIIVAKLGNAPSLIWRSVWNSLGLLKEGLRWKVGDGVKINIWGQKWLLSPSTYCVQSPISILDANSKVRDLIDEDSKDWNEGLIGSIFNKKEAAHAGNNLLATRGNIFTKKVIENPLCPIYLKEEETVMHVLWLCPAASDVWAESHKATQKWSIMETDLLKLWEGLERKLNKIELEEVAVIMRGLWMRRNNFIFDNKFMNLSSIIRSARESLEEYHLADEGLAVSSRGGVSRVEVIQK